MALDRETRNNAPPPTIASMRTQGVRNVRMSCRGPDCGRTVVMSFDKIGLLEATSFPQIARLRRWVCQKCGSREVSVRPDWSAPKEG